MHCAMLLFPSYVTLLAHANEHPCVVSHLLTIMTVVLLFGTHQRCHFSVPRFTRFQHFKMAALMRTKQQDNRRDIQEM